MEYQLSHEECKALHKNFQPNIIFVLENFEHDENIGAAFRLADSFNIKKLIIVTQNQIAMKKVAKTARNCEKCVEFEVVGSIDAAIESAKKEGCQPLCVDYTSQSKPLREIDFSNMEGVAFIMGNERSGISERAMELSGQSVHIDMYGKNTSMNVATALAIVSYKASEDILKKNHVLEVNNECVL